MLRFTPGPQVAPVNGDILMSEPFLDDPYFGRKVVLVCEHGAAGTFGFVLNNFLELDVHEVAEGVPATFGKVGVGGPVNVSTLYYLHRFGDVPGAQEVMEGLYMGGDFDVLSGQIQSGQTGPDDIRFFVGYAGWEAGQLDAEIQSRSWFVSRTGVDIIMDATIDNEDYWKQRISDLGDGYAHIAGAPSDPSLN